MASRGGGGPRLAASRSPSTTTAPASRADQYEDVFKAVLPSRRDRATSDTGGVGLGLTIARDVARSHGGDVALAPSSLGGLRVVVRIPT